MKTLFCTVLLLATSLWGQIRVATITDETTPSSKVVMLALRSKIASHPSGLAGILATRFLSCSYPLIMAYERVLTRELPDQRAMITGFSSTSWTRNPKAFFHRHGTILTQVFASRTLVS